jgi:hypothetical protein
MLLRNVGTLLRSDAVLHTHTPDERNLPHHFMDKLSKTTTNLS